MAKIYGKNFKVFIKSEDIPLHDGTNMVMWEEITGSIVGGIGVRKFGIRKVHAPLLTLELVRLSILATNTSYSQPVITSNDEYEYIVYCEHKPEKIINIEWLELKD